MTEYTVDLQMTWVKVRYTADGSLRSVVGDAFDRLASAAETIPNFALGVERAYTKVIGESTMYVQVSSSSAGASALPFL